MYISYIYDDIALNSLNGKFFIQTSLGKSKLTLFFNDFFFWKSCRLWGNVEKSGTAIQTTDYSIIWRMCFTC